MSKFWREHFLLIANVLLVCIVFGLHNYDSHGIMSQGIGHIIYNIRAAKSVTITIKYDYLQNWSIFTQRDKKTESL